MTKIKNLNGTGAERYKDPPKGYSSWKSWWEAQAGRSFSTCSCSGCTSKAAVGAHVQKSGSADKKWYIVPLCSACNHKSSDEVFEVRDADLVAINS